MSAETESADVQMPVAAAPEPAAEYVGLATRAIAFTLDAALITLVAIIVLGGAAVIVSLLHLPKDVRIVLAAIGGAADIVWSATYFVVFWSTTGQTPGARVMQVRVVTAKGETPTPRRALLRCGGVLLAALPLFAGYVRILFDSRRRGFQDRLAGTVVVAATQLSMAEARRAKKRAAYEAERLPLGSSEHRPGTSSDSDDDRDAAVLKH